MIRLEDFDFPLDEDLIAKYPSPNRDESRLMVVERATGKISVEPFFKNIQNYLLPSDRIFFNETRVSKRRVYLYSQNREHEVLFLEKLERNDWVALIKNSRKLKLGDWLLSPGKTVSFEVLEKREKDCILRSDQPLEESFFESEGNIPIPPYLRRKAEKSDEDRYQTIFATKPGSVAAPTAALHMTEELRINLEKQGIRFFPIHLQIGFGTFQPITQEDLIAKKLHKETIQISRETRLAWKVAGENKCRRIALGTTTLRALESMKRFAPDLDVDWESDTEIFLAPGDQIDTIEGIITNFHLPKSSLILLIAAFGGSELIQKAYQIAVKERFRFFSYGDAMLII